MERLGSKDYDKRFAVLIDGDNISEKYIKAILAEVANDGIATYRRVYSDWTKTDMSSWKRAVVEHSLQPMQQFSNTKGKNATDSAMIIDAMDILYSGQVDGFYIVSSDSDFTALARRLRESGMEVVGMGESKTPTSFRGACSRFKVFDAGAGLGSAAASKVSETVHMATLEMVKSSILSFIRDRMESVSNDGDWVFVSAIGHYLSKLYPDFNAKTYGFKSLVLLMETMEMLEFEKRSTSNTGAQVVLARLKEQEH